MMTWRLQWKVHHRHFCSEEGTFKVLINSFMGKGIASIGYREIVIRPIGAWTFVIAETIKEKSILNILDNFEIACCSIGWLSRTRFNISCGDHSHVALIKLDVPARWVLKFSKHSAFLLRWEMRAHSFLKVRQQWLQLTSLSITINQCIDTKHTQSFWCTFCWHCYMTNCCQLKPFLVLCRIRNNLQNKCSTRLRSLSDNKPTLSAACRLQSTLTRKRVSQICTIVRLFREWETILRLASHLVPSSLLDNTIVVWGMQNMYQCTRHSRLAWDKFNNYILLGS